MILLLALLMIGGRVYAENGFSAESTVQNVIEHPAFVPYGRFMLPLEWGYDPDMPLARVSSLLPYHSNMDVDEVVKILGHMSDMAMEGSLAFYDIYADEQKKADPTKENTGLFFFRGEPDKPFAIVCAGGGFSYVGSIHESFPHAIEISEKGYNAFAIQYRTGGADVACEDLAAAITFIFENAQALAVGTSNYSLWGGSAGARMAAYLGSYGPATYGGGNLPRPATVVMQYTGHSDYTQNDPPTFVVIGDRDGIASPTAMERRVNTLQSLGIDAEYHLYPNVGHGFGLGLGTSAEGWLDEAVSFWEKYID